MPLQRSLRAAATALSLTLAACAPPDPEAALAKAWPDSCARLKSQLAGNPGVDVRFGALPEPLPATPVWALRWDGRVVPVPRASYTKLSVRLAAATPDAGDMVMLLDEAGHAVFLSYHAGFAPVADAFGTVALVGGRVTSDKEGARLTRLLWGGPVGLGEMIHHGYEWSLDRLGCRPEHWRAEMAGSIGLILKSVAADGVGEAYPLSERPLGWLVRERGSERQRWMATWLRDDGADLATGVELWFPPDAADAEAGLLLAAGALAAAEPPPWLRALQAALERNDRAAWEALAGELPAAGFDGRSQERLADFIRERFEPPRPDARSS